MDIRDEDALVRDEDVLVADEDVLTPGLDVLISGEDLLTFNPQTGDATTMSSNNKKPQAEPNTGTNLSTTSVAATAPAAMATATDPTPAAPAPTIVPTPLPPVPLPPVSTGPGVVKPPPNVTIPSPPAGFVPANPKDYRGYRPTSSELSAVPDAVMELQSFANYATVFGSTAPSVSDLTQALDASLAWTALLADSHDWESYVKSQEGMGWMATLALVEKLKAPFALATANDPSLASRYPSLARLLGAAKVIAKRGAASKARKAAAEAGKPSTAKAKKAAAAAATAHAVTPAPPTPVAAAPAAGSAGSGTHA